MESQPPFLLPVTDNKQLFVNGKPFLMRAAELQNSSLSSADYMRGIWPRLVEANINTVLGSVTWEQIEPVEGSFDFSEVTKIVENARGHNLHLVLLWFGSFKNGMSTYAPGWVKKDVKRFPRAILRKEGGRLEVADALSIFHGEAQKADARAFKALMEHLRAIDEADSTVIMVQVENEVGLLGDSRDGGAAANQCFNSPVPKKLVDTLLSDWAILHHSLKNGLLKNLRDFSVDANTSWEAVFGPSPQTDELFMAYHYALYLEEVASAGKEAYNIPLYTNVWQNYADEDSDNDFPVVVGGGGQPGTYPSGGGVINVLDIWLSFAPSLAMISPDIYLNNYTATCEKYRHRSQPLFIPEQRRDEYGARRIWAAFGSFQALGTAPFGIDTLELDDNPFRKHYGLLAKVSYHVLEAQRSLGTSVGFFFDELRPSGDDPSPPITAFFDSWKLHIERSFVFGKPGPGFGMVIHKGGARFLLIGEGFQVKFSSTKPKSVFTGILKFVEKEVVNEETGEMRSLRILGGDETRSGQAAVMPVENPDYGSFPISITIPANTRIAECEVYALEEEAVHLLN
ncbi:hypothetical protein FQN50_001272 [Emmonsiellopsis sp. PD_5]|nr:hypothetical protein FQN50_001272 [Emmonsiellopsis sp. PD_5]